MMEFLRLILITILMTATTLVIGEESVMDAPLAGTTLRFGDGFASAFYTVNEENFEVVVTFATGSEDNEQPIQQTIQLKNGQTYNVSIGGFGNARDTATLSLTRKDDHILAHVSTDSL